jgi:hypothetical protein
MVFSVWFFRIRGVDKKVVVIVSHVTCRNEQMAETESVRHGFTPYRDTDEDVKASPRLRVRRDALLTPDWIGAIAGSYYLPKN